MQVVVEPNEHTQLWLEMKVNDLEMSPEKSDLRTTIKTTLFPAVEGCFRKNTNST